MEREGFISVSLLGREKPQETSREECLARGALTGSGIPVMAHLLEPLNARPFLLRSHHWALEALVAEVQGLSVHGQSPFQAGLLPQGPRALAGCRPLPHCPAWGWLSLG